MKTKTYIILGILIALLVGLSIGIQSKIIWVLSFSSLLVISVIYINKNYAKLNKDVQK